MNQQQESLSKRVSWVGACCPKARRCCLLSAGRAVTIAGFYSRCYHRKETLVHRLGMALYACLIRTVKMSKLEARGGEPN